MTPTIEQATQRWSTHLATLERWHLQPLPVTWPDGIRAAQPTDLTWQHWWTPVVGPVPVVALGHLHYLVAHPRHHETGVTTGQLADHLTPINDQVAVDEYPRIRWIAAATTLVLHRLIVVTADRVLLPTPIPGPGRLMSDHIDTMLTTSAKPLEQP